MTLRGALRDATSHTRRILRDRRQKRSLRMTSMSVGEWRRDGFARLVTDRATFGYLADVFVLESHPPAASP